MAKRGKKALKVLAASVSVLALASLSAWFWYHHRAQPPNERRRLFDGVEYVRESTKSPRPLVIHVISVDLDAQGINFVTTNGVPHSELPYKAQLTTQFLGETGCQVAINADFFLPWHSTAPWDYYPHVGDPCHPYGLTVHDGTILYNKKEYADRPTLFLNGNRASFSRPQSLENAISGDLIFVQDGKVRKDRIKLPYHTELHPRLAIGLDKAGRHLIILVVDGRQPSYSEGVDMQEMGEIAIRHGVDIMMNLDGGGSTTLVCQDRNGQPELLNCPIDNHIPNRERPVANHLGIRARQ